MHTAIRAFAISLFFISNSVSTFAQYSEIVSDFNGDDVVDILDLARLTGSWLDSDCDLNQWCGGCDLDHSKKIDIKDLSMFAESWGFSRHDVVGYWKLDQTSGSYAFDSSGSGNIGILLNTPLWTAGYIENALTYNSIQDALAINTTGLTSFEGAVSAWVKPESFSATNYIFGHSTEPDPATFANRIQIYTASAGQLAIGLGSSHSTRTNIETLSPNKWYHIALTYAAGRYAFYINGVLKAQGTYTGLDSLAPTAHIGNDGHSGYANEAFFGVLDEVKLFSRPPDANEIADLYLDGLTSHAFGFAKSQLIITAASLGPTQYPAFTSSYTFWDTTDSGGWTSGFFPGSLWLAYEYCQDSALETYARSFTAGLASEAENTSTNDLGFMIFNTFGNGYRLTRDTNYKPVVLQAAASVSSRYNPVVGCIKVSDIPVWEFPLNIDSIMNMELLFWSGRSGGSPQLTTQAQNHINLQVQDLVRPNGSTFHYADYDPTTGNLIANSTWQGYSADSTWSRGQAWAIYGFTMAYRFTADPVYLDTACRAADFYLANLPADLVPYWDFDAPGIPNTQSDTSAASVTASGLFELSKYCTGQTHSRYYNAACSILKNLCTPDDLGGYLGESSAGTVLSEGILMHGCYHAPECFSGSPWAYDESLSWGDYYLIEALLRYKNQ